MFGEEKFADMTKVLASGIISGIFLFLTSLYLRDKDMFLKSEQFLDEICWNNYWYNNVCQFSKSMSTFKLLHISHRNEYNISHSTFEYFSIKYIVSVILSLLYLYWIYVIIKDKNIKIRHLNKYNNNFKLKYIILYQEKCNRINTTYA